MILRRPTARWSQLPFVLLLGLTGCTAGAMQAFSEGFAAASTAPAKLMLFGDQGHDTYLGCLSCAEYVSDSVLNEYGRFGSPYRSESIFNPYGQYGSRYSQVSACNPYASDPPVVVDAQGNYYGRLTVNRYHAERFGDGDILAWLEDVCR